MTIGENLKKMRLEIGITQSELSRLSGISRTCISEIESNTHSNITIYVLCSICKTLKVTPNDLIPDEFYK